MVEGVIKSLNIKHGAIFLGINTDLEYSYVINYEKLEVGRKDIKECLIKCRELYGDIVAENYDKFHQPLEELEDVQIEVQPKIKAVQWVFDGGEWKVM